MNSKLEKLAYLNPARLPRNLKSFVIVATDIVLLAASLWMAFYIRLGIYDPTDFVNDLDLAIILGVSVAALIGFRLYRIKLNAFDQSAITRLAVLAFCLVIISTNVDFFGYSGLPRSLPLIYGATFFLSAIFVRMAALRFILFMNRIGGNRVPVAIYGAGSAGTQLALSLMQSAKVMPVCFVDDNPSLQGLIISGLKVHSAKQLPKLIERKTIRQVLLAMPSISTGNRMKLVSKLAALKCEIQIIPSYVDLVAGRSTVSDLRTVQPEELLHRGTVDLDSPEMHKAYAGRIIMVTGAGGSIGSELCRQLLTCGPKRIVLFERSEHALYELDSELSEPAKAAGIRLVRCLASVTDRAAVDHAIEKNKVDIILHAAAYKHVPLIEENEVEGARNNILGTFEVAEAAFDADIERFILVSTDKAVRPTNVMGATKRIAELIVLSLQKKAVKTRFSMVRFGNVLGSSGSVVPLFGKQIASGGPVTLTHRDITRYFMTIPEAARLVLLAGSYSKGDDLFILDMGQPIRIIDLAYKMIELAGLSVRSETNPDGDIEIQIIGLRPGEKLHEELFFEAGALKQSAHKKILISHEKPRQQRELSRLIKTVREGVDARDHRAVRTAILSAIECEISSSIKR